MLTLAVTLRGVGVGYLEILCVQDCQRIFHSACLLVVYYKYI